MTVVLIIVGALLLSLLLGVGVGKFIRGPVPKAQRRKRP